MTASHAGTRLGAALLACSVVACKDPPRSSPAPARAPATAPSDAGLTAEHPPIPVDAPPPPPGDWELCKAGLAKAAVAPPTKRVQTILDACHPCGDWAPILDWQTLQEDGGPNRKLIEQRMEQCKAWCTPNAKVRFMGTLDDARAKKSRTPWRELGTQCLDAVSAATDARFVSAPFFALDRVARWAATQPGGEAALAPIVIPLPAVSQTGVGMQLPETAVTKPDLVANQITLTATTVTGGPMPVAKLTAKGVEPQGAPYPGPALAADTQLDGTVAVFAHPALPAKHLWTVFVHVKNPVVLAVRSSIGMPGWDQHGISPVTITTQKPLHDAISIELDATGQAAIAQVKSLGAAGVKDKQINLRIDETSTIGGLATVLGALAYFEVPSVIVNRKPAK